MRKWTHVALVGGYMNDQRFLTLFTFNNVAFSTKRPNSSSTLYFENQGIVGRWRREHRDGESIVYGGHATRIFVSADGMGLVETDVDVTNNQRQQALRAMDPGRISAEPVLGWHVWETNGAYWHGSGGSVQSYQETRREAGELDFAALRNTPDAQVVDWDWW